MSFFFSFENSLLIAISIIALAALACPKPSLSAIFLFLESILISLFLKELFGYMSTPFGASVLLSFISMIVVGCNFYLEISFKRSKIRMPKLNILFGLFFLIIFLKNIDVITLALIEQPQSMNDLIAYDGVTLIIMGFALFSILVAALTIFHIKNEKSGDLI
jgi:hypothetical protein